jgi:hypothetical protein
MTEPTRVGEVVPGVVAEVVDRAGRGYARWAELVTQAGYCHHPIRLAGRIEHADRQTGEVGNRCAKCRSPRSRPTVEVEVMCSRDVQLCAVGASPRFGAAEHTSSTS